MAEVQSIAACPFCGELITSSLGNADRVSVKSKGRGSTRTKYFALMVAIIGGILTTVVVVVGAYVLGGIRGTREIYHRQYQEERKIVVPMLAANPAFANVTVEEYSGGGISLYGQVKSSAELEKLKAEVTRLIGELRVKQGVVSVSVK